MIDNKRKMCKIIDQLTIKYHVPEISSDYKIQNCKKKLLQVTIVQEHFAFLKAGAKTNRPEKNWLHLNSFQNNDAPGIFSLNCL